MSKQTHFQNMDNYFFKYNKWLFLKIVQVYIFIEINKWFGSFYYGYTH
jgi:hypothetical protein